MKNTLHIYIIVSDEDIKKFGDYLDLIGSEIT